MSKLYNIVIDNATVVHLLGSDFAKLCMGSCASEVNLITSFSSESSSSITSTSSFSIQDVRYDIDKAPQKNYRRHRYKKRNF